MAKVSPWHSTKVNDNKQKNVYHNNDECTTGNNIETKYRKTGQGVGRSLCKDCANIQIAENTAKAIFESVKPRLQ